MLELASNAFYNHGETSGGIILVIVFCGALILWGLFVAWYNFASTGPVKRRAREASQS